MRDAITRYGHHAGLLYDSRKLSTAKMAEERRALDVLHENYHARL